MEEINNDIIKRPRGRPRKPENIDKIIVEKRSVGRPKKIKPYVEKKPKGKPLNTKNGYEKTYTWQINSFGVINDFKNIRDIASHLKCSEQKICRIIYGNVTIPHITITKHFKNNEVNNNI